MAVKFKDEQPGKFWYFRKTLGGVAKTFSDRFYQTRARSMRRDGAISTGAFVLGGVIASVHAAAAVPLLATVGPFVLGCAGLAFGFKAYRGFADLKRTPVAVKHIRESEEKWLAKKQRAPFFKRVLSAIAKPFKFKKKGAAAQATAAAQTAGKTIAAQAKPKKFLFFFNRKAAKPETAASNPAANSNTPAPAAKPAVVIPDDAESIAAAKARAQVRKQRKTTPRF